MGMSLLHVIIGSTITAASIYNVIIAFCKKDELFKHNT